jgi:hypothetical protein
MIKGVREAGTGKALSYLDTLVVPIIDNTPFEEDLKDSMALVRLSPAFPTCCANRLCLGFCNHDLGNEKVPERGRRSRS